MKGKLLLWASRCQSIALTGQTSGSRRYDSDIYEKMIVKKKIKGSWLFKYGWAEVNSVSESYQIVQPE